MLGEINKFRDKPLKEFDFPKKSVYGLLVHRKGDGIYSIHPLGINIYTLGRNNVTQKFFFHHSK
jgi:hypothetical protein